MGGAKQGGCPHMVILVVGRNFSEELTLNLEFSPIVPWLQTQDPMHQVEIPHAEKTNLIGQEIWLSESRTANVHVTSWYLYIYTLYYAYNMILSICLL